MSLGSVDRPRSAILADRWAAAAANSFGPLSITEVCNWPHSVWQSFVEGAKSGRLAAGSMERLHNLLTAGVAVCSAYSGMAGDIMGCQWMFQALLSSSQSTQ